MANRHGDFIWYELLTTDTDAALRFYGELVGWEAAPAGPPDPDYRVLQMKDAQTGEAHGIGGLLQLTPDMQAGGARPTWLGYIAVEDVDATLTRLAAAGGTVQMPAMDIPGVGRIAMVGDPQGAPFYVMKPIPPADRPDAESLAFAADRPRPGHCAWNELTTSDQAGAWAFYGELFGWTQDGEMPMGPLGSYQFVRHGHMLGAFSPLTPEVSGPVWTYYFRVPDIDAAMRGVSAGGGELAHGPDEIPGGDFIVHGIDPQGAAFALVGSRS